MIDSASWPESDGRPVNRTRRTGIRMKLFVDSANLEDIGQALRQGCPPAVAPVMARNRQHSRESTAVRG